MTPPVIKTVPVTVIVTRSQENALVTLDGPVSAVTSLTALVCRTVMTAGTVTRHLTRPSAQTVLDRGWVRHALIPALMGSRHPWILDRVFAIQAGQGLDVTLSVLDMERLSTKLACVTTSLATRGHCVTSLAVLACSSSIAAGEVSVFLASS